MRILLDHAALVVDGAAAAGLRGLVLNDERAVHGGVNDAVVHRLALNASACEADVRVCFTPCNGVKVNYYWNKQTLTIT